MNIITARAHRLLGVCVKRIGEMAARGERCMFLVPAQYTLQAERNRQEDFMGYFRNAVMLG